MRWNYKKIRLALGWFIIITAFAVMTWLLYREWSTPLLQPEITSISSVLPPKTTPPTTQEKADYSVPPTHPKHLIIPKLGVNTNIYPVGLTKKGAIDAPQTAWGVGWYNKSVLPGENGAMLIDGHVNDSFNTPGVFYELKSLVPGDSIQIERGDGQSFSYRVVTIEQQPLEKTDVARLLQSITPGKPGLNLVTCGGAYDRKRQTYADRVVVFAEQILP